MVKPDGERNPLRSIGRVLAEKVSAEAAAPILLVIVAGVVVEAISIKLNNAVVGYLFIGLCVAALVVIVVSQNKSGDVTNARLVDADQNQFDPPSVSSPVIDLQLTLTDRAEFDGGMEELTDVLLGWRDSVPRRRIAIKSVALTDRSWRTAHPDDYLNVLDAVNRFERCVNAAISIGYQKSGDRVEWHKACLLRLRDLIFLAPVPPGERWFTWQVGSDRMVPFDIAEGDVQTIRSGYYEHPDGVGIPGLRSRPIWIRQLDPREVWQWIIPAVVVAWLKAGDDPANLRFDQWLFSDKEPSKLELPPIPRP
jgi:hypothetical protein